MTAPANYPNSTLVAVAWFNSIPGIEAASQLPKDTAWGPTGFVRVEVVGGSPNAYLPQGEPVVEVHCSAVQPDTGRPLWNVAGNVASAVIRALRDETTKQRTLTLPIGYADCRVIQAYAVGEPTRDLDDEGSYACWSFPIFFRWTLINREDV